MSKPRVFIASSVEGLKIAQSLQELLEHEAYCTIWNQGVFTLSGVTLDQLRRQAQISDFAVFVFSPDDVATIRKGTWHVVRDNVILELGLFTGVLGRERCFMVQPRNAPDFHVPSDVMGLTPADFDAERPDKNWVAALGTAANRIRHTMQQATGVSTAGEKPKVSVSLGDADIRVALRSWLQGRDVKANTKAIRFSEVDAELGLSEGGAKAHLNEVAATLGYVVLNVGETQILFAKRDSGRVGGGA